MLEANTWAQLSEIQQERLIASYVDLYQDAYKKYGIQTHDLAEAMFNYLLVKDGGQFTNGSFIRMLPPFIFKDIMDKIGEANNLMKVSKGNYEGLFGKGVTQQSMLTDFMRGYTTHVANRKYILQVDRPKSKFEPSRGDNMHGQAYSALSKEDKARVNTHNNVKGASIIFQKNQELTVNALGGIRSFDDQKTGKFDPAEKVMLMDNKEHLDQIGFNKAKNGITFPVSFQYNNRLYTLQEVYKMDEAEGKWKPVMRDVFISAGEFAPTGLKAKYVEHKWEGSPRQFPAASAAGPVPEYKPTEKEQKKIAKDNKGITDERIKGIMVKDGYRLKTFEKAKDGKGESILGQRVEDKNGKPVTDSEGKTFGNLVSAYKALQEQKTGQNTEQKSEPSTVTSQPITDTEKLIGGVFKSDELNDLYKSHVKEKGDQAMSPSRFKSEVMEYLSETTTQTKEEMIREIKCL